MDVPVNLHGFRKLSNLKDLPEAFPGKEEIEKSGEYFFQYSARGIIDSAKHAGTGK